jgi:hypothetical protein
VDFLGRSGCFLFVLLARAALFAVIRQWSYVTYMGVRVLLGPLGLGLVSCIQVHQRRRLVIAIIGIDAKSVYVLVVCLLMYHLYVSDFRLRRSYRLRLRDCVHLISHLHICQRE